MYFNEEETVEIARVYASITRWQEKFLSEQNHEVKIVYARLILNKFSRLKELIPTDMQSDLPVNVSLLEQFCEKVIV